MASKKRMLLLIAFLSSLLVAKHYFRNKPTDELKLSDWFKPRSRSDVITTTGWLAPVLWEGLFHRQPLEKFYRRRNVTVGLAVFTVGRFAENELDLFLQSADRFFMPSHRVIFYIMAATYPYLPPMAYNPLRSVQVLLLDEELWWYDLDLVRMKSLAKHILSHIRDEVDFLFSMTADLVFETEFGVETLATSVAQLHAWWYFRNTQNFPYERRLQSAAYIPFGQGDFFYGGSIVGGTPDNVLSLVEEYLAGLVQDIQKRVNSTYEKYLNKFFFLHKPAKLLSPEYGWNPKFQLPPQMRLVRVSHHPRAHY
ncbi:putative glycosyltransferase 6 domain-containing protein 1 [Perognathus longimembris pacificus]|uniref:glycosyltransferase 6 domain-containing protein 1-like n=1 Tax=Perognathus longimembris pacificus TaxID=214514 RepID=UPI0020188B9C|nr:glycosyltransferase 6 domain-containing protein 1-like [Perognathus longimembris pacificus]XP_048204997.1 putative glycosyltransferase 6 domain-containing protein 1 [Perognathus longimembris pacificus]